MTNNVRRIQFAKHTVCTISLSHKGFTDWPNMIHDVSYITLWVIEKAVEEKLEKAVYKAAVL